MSFQVTKSQYEVVPDGRPHRFEANVDIERGDIVGVELSGGASIGVRRDVPGAETGAGCPVRGREAPILGPGTGFDHEVLLRVDFVPGATRPPGTDPR